MTTFTTVMVNDRALDSYMTEGYEHRFRQNAAIYRLTNIEYLYAMLRERYAAGDISLEDAAETLALHGERVNDVLQFLLALALEYNGHLIVHNPADQVAPGGSVLE